jgi:hypothetical protein
MPSELQLSLLALISAYLKHFLTDLFHLISLKYPESNLVI